MLAFDGVVVDRQFLCGLVFKLVAGGRVVASTSGRFRFGFCFLGHGLKVVGRERILDAQDLCIDLV